MLPFSQGTLWQIFILLHVVLLIDETKSEGRVVCYYTNWSVYRPGTAKFNPQNINPYLCTHLIYAFGGFTKDNTLKPFDKYQDIEQGGYAKFTGLKSFNKNLKTLLAIGGWNEASSRFSPLVANPDRRQQFIKNILKFLRQNHFDGLDLDWEYPAHRDGGKARDKDNYAQFVQELRAEFERESSKTGRPRLLLTMAVPAGIEYVEKGYDIPKLNKYLDWFNILSYDYHSAYEPSVNHHAPLYSLEDESEYNYDGELNIDYTVKYYLNAGAEKDKLVLGIPTYGRSYTLINEESTDIGSPSDGPGDQGDATREKGYLAYYEICQNIRNDPDWIVSQPNPKVMGPYAFKDNQWVGYDDEAMARKKGEYVANNGLGGIMFWSIDNDDFRGICTGKPYPLIEAAKEALLDNLRFDINEVSKPSNPKKPLRSKSRQNATNRNRITSPESLDRDVSEVSRKEPTRRPSVSRKRITTTQTPSTTSSSYNGRRITTPEPPTTPDPGSDFKCEEEGFFQHPRDCKKYFWCLDSGPSNLGIVAHQFTCPSGLYFNPAADSCDFSRNVLCNQKSTKNNGVTTTTTNKPQTTTTTTTTNRPKLTAATSRNSFRYSPSTTTTEATYEYEDDDEVVEEEKIQHRKDNNDDVASEEDPKVIKELIDLIKKVGGIEELEKILQQDGDVMSLKTDKFSNIITTESTISKSLYEKVLRRPNSLSSFQNHFNALEFQKKLKKTETTEEKTNIKSALDKIENKYSSVVRNGRPSPQNDGIEKLSEFSGFLKEKPKYVTITRTTPSQRNQENFSQEVIDHQLTNEEDEISYDLKHKSATSTPNYKSIRRFRPVTVHNATRANVLSEDIIKIETNPSNKSENHRQFKNSYNDESTIQTNFAKEINVLSSPASVNIVQRTRTPNVEETSTVNYDSKDEKQYTVTVDIVDENENTTLSPTKHDIFTTSRIYSNFTRKTSPQIKLNLENSTTKQESKLNSLNATTITPAIPTPITIESFSTTINYIPTITTIPNITINPLNNNSISNTTHTSILQNITEFNGSTQVNETKQTENNFDETETKANTTDEVLIKNSIKDYNLEKEFNSGSLKITVKNSDNNNININNSNSNNLNKIKIKINKTDTEKTNLDINKTSEFQTTVAKPKPYDFIQRRVRPTSPKSLSNSKTAISDSLSSIDNEISTKELKQKFRQSSLRPVFSVRRRVTPVTNLPKYSSTNLVEQITTMLPLPDETTNVKYNRRISQKYRATTERSNTELNTNLKTTPTHTRYNSNKPTVVHQIVNKRTYVRPEKRRSTTVNLEEIDTTTVESTKLRNTNALFRRRYTSTTPTNSQKLNILTTLPASTINVDQETGSSIQDSKFTNNQLTNIDVGKNTVESIKTISRRVLSDIINTTPQIETHSDFLEVVNEHLTNIKANKTIPRKNFPTTKQPQRISKRPHKIDESNKNHQFSQRTYRPIIDYDYYDEEDVRVVSKSNSLVKVILHGQGTIECLDQGNFPHPLSCRKFISCAKMGKDAEGPIGWEYTCPKGLSYDPVGGICNWASGLGCKE